MNSENKMSTSDIVFIGSGISSSFTILNLLDRIEEQEVIDKVNITIIDKFHEFHTGIPYGGRSGFSVHLITSLKNFLPEPELSKFLVWLNANKTWLLDELRKDGGKLSLDWLETHAGQIEGNQWNDLFIPRRFFGMYIYEKVNNKLEAFKAKGLIDVTCINEEVIDLDKKESGYKLFLKNGGNILSKKVVLSVGSLPVNNLWKEEGLIEEENLLFINNPYTPTLTDVLGKIEGFLEKNSNKKVNTLIVGANASGLEMLYKLNDIEKIKSSIDKFTILSTQGLLPDAVIDIEKKKDFKPSNLLALANNDNITAEIIAEATYKDLDYADKIELGAASTVDIVSKAFGSLLCKLSPKELEKFACHYGNQIGRRQRCAGVHYSKTVDGLKNEERFEHIAGRFINIDKNSLNLYELEYLDTVSGDNKKFEAPFHIVINCVGSTNFEKENVPLLLKNLIRKGYCKPNESKIGFEVNQSLEASEDLHVAGPLLAGNVFDGKAVWHVEHCGRIIWLSQVLSQRINDDFFKKSLK